MPINTSASKDTETLMSGILASKVRQPALDENRNLTFLTLRTMTGPDASRPPSTYWLTRFVLLRFLGFVYAVAFLAAARQILPLIGSRGLLPVSDFLTRVEQ